MVGPRAVAATSPTARRASPRLIALIVASAMFMEQLDGTVLATALPTMARTFHVDPLRMSVALTAYLLSLAVFIPASGKAADRFGARTVFRAAIGLFMLGSVLCAQAPTLPFLVASRIIQGLGGAMMMPVGRLVLLRTVSKSELVSAMTWLMLPASIGPILGPPFGGFIVTWLDWRWIFYINLPVGALGLVMATLFIEDVHEPGPVQFDVFGLLLSGVSLSSLMFGIEFFTRGGTSQATALALLVVGVVAAMLYWRHARMHPQPVLDFRLMRVATFRISVLAGSLSRIAVGANPFLLPMMMQLGFGLSAAQSGLITCAGAGGSLLVRGIAASLLRRLGFRHALVWVGLIATAMMACTAAFRPAWPTALIYAVLIIGGFCTSLQFMAYNTVAYADVPRERMSAATSFYTTFQQMTLTLGIAVAAASLAASREVFGHAEPQLADFSRAYVIVSLVALFAPLVSLSLDPAAGEEMSGHHR